MLEKNIAQTFDSDKLKEAIADFLESRRAAARRPSTVENYRIFLNVFWRYCQTNQVGWPPTTKDLRGFLASKRDQGVRDITLAGYTRHLAAFFNWLVLDGQLEDDQNPIARLTKPRARKRLPKSVDKERIKNLLDVMQEHAQSGDRLAIRDLAMIRFTYDSGCRASEACRLELDDLNLQRQSAVIRDSKGADRTIFFGHVTALALAAWLAVRGRKGNTVFVGRFSDGRPLRRNAIRLRIIHWCVLAGIPPLSTHQLRHSHAMHALRAGVPITDLRHQLGHANLTTTALYLDGDSPERANVYYALSPSDRLTVGPARRDPPVIQERRPPEALLTIGEVARRLNVTKGLAYTLVREGKIPAIQISKQHVRVRAEDVEMFIESERR